MGLALFACGGVSGVDMLKSTYSAPKAQFVSVMFDKRKTRHILEDGNTCLWRYLAIGLVNRSMVNQQKPTFP